MQATCARGHIYDSDQYAACPYCNRNSQAIFFGNNGTGKTTMPGGFGATTAPQNIQRTVGPDISGGDGGFRNEDVGRTEAPDFVKDRMKKEEKNRTVGVFKKKFGLDPVVGWLVCIEGPEKGKDYRLLDRINTIGRGAENDVVLELEPTVSQRNHARLAYDAKHNNFQMIPGEGHNITYLNEMPLYVPQLLHAYDVIEFGETKLLFIPLCTEQFQWKQVNEG